MALRGQFAHGHFLSEGECKSEMSQGTGVKVALIVLQRLKFQTGLLPRALRSLE